ncbi:penicillin-binding protein [Piscibacillus halophilus]|uniref:penicillin-binding protein n=1 Tax=Piscibacillus halophilus TaxID=571933 RepID=UPI00158CF1F0|nr:penicillin-binding protein [Piscibacillus halophilus]
MTNLNYKNVMSFLIISIFSLIFLFLIGRFAYIQITGEVQSVDLLYYAEKFRNTSSVLEAERGEIYDQTGMVLAGNKTVYNMYAVLSEEYSQNSSVDLHVKDIQKTASSLAPIIGMEEQQIIDILEEGKEEGSFQVEFGRFGNGLSKEQKEEIEELDLTGIYFEQDTERYYPNGAFASHVIGFTEDRLNEDKTKYETVGAYGIEQMYDEHLGGKDGFIRSQRDKYGFKLLNADEHVQSPEHGHDVFLTIDQKIQTFLEDTMTTVQEEYNPKRMVAIVMNPKTGEVLAMSNRPSFDPNTRDEIENWYNDAISTPFEPGSTMKIFTLSAAIEEGVYNGDATFESGRWRINENRSYISDHNNGEGWGEITYNQAVQHSSNVGFAKILWEQLKPEKYLEYISAFQLDQPTEIDLEGERVGQITYTYPRDQINTAIGQGSTFTPIQIMKGATALANGGKMMKPYITSRISDINGNKTLYKAEPEVVGEPISEDTANQVKDILETVITSEDGTGGPFKLDNFTSFGKTGTAQIPDPSGGYKTGIGEYVYSFIGMAPKDDPKLMMYVAVEEPEVEYSYYGSQTTSYIYKTVMENSLHYLEIEPDQSNEDTIEPIKLNQLYDRNTDTVVNELEEQGFNVTVLGNGDQIVDSLPKENESVYPNKRIILETNGELTMPDLTNWTLRDVFSLVELVDMELDFMGEGFVTKQNISAGSSISDESKLVVELSSKSDSNEEDDEESENEEIEEGEEVEGEQ